MNDLIEKSTTCPYCGEFIEVLIDISDLNNQYIEDCQVCCKPIIFLISESGENGFSIRVYSEDETIL